MMRFVSFCLLVLALPVLAAGTMVNTPGGNKVEIFSRSDLVDILALLQLAGIKVSFSAASGSYVAASDGHEVHFTPGGSLAVVDGDLVSLPGPVRILERHVVAAVTTCAAILRPFEWRVVGDAGALSLVAAGSTPVVESRLEVTGEAATFTFSALPEVPRVVAEVNGFRLLFSRPVQLATPPAGQGVFAGVQLQEKELFFLLAPGWQLVQHEMRENSESLILRLEKRASTAKMVTPRPGLLVVLDPGHGGEDQGAKGPSGVLEKDLTLAIARQVAARLQQAGITARLTRDEDETVALSDRVALANRLQADCFVSLHANAAPTRGARGAETYFMSPEATDQEAARAAARENAPSGPVPLILWELAHVANLEASSALALELQTRLNQLSGIRDRGVKQAPFLVLTGATMPAVLVEVGFLTNPEEETRLISPGEQARIASAAAGAILAFLNKRSVSTPTP